MVKRQLSVVSRQLSVFNLRSPALGLNRATLENLDRRMAFAGKPADN